ncbi:helix-turn-helix transcriptional regulator [Ottowia thiooxydans]|uniref:helix-turn-helix transcriptional regulator n=1 Tax=Ottowia thiooxydans TaxID=219182 RepID=UPI000422B056|nr:helix-turn-helix transcriptional regulator [Ottowia thiooxydans]
MQSSHIHQQATERLQLMACLDFSGLALIEPVMHELHQLIAFDTGVYFHPDASGALDAYIEPSVAREWMHRYFDPQMAALEHEVVNYSSHDFAAAVRHEHGVRVMEQLISVPRSVFVRSDFYNQVARPSELQDFLSLVLRTPQGRGLGSLKLCRKPGAPCFTPADTAVLAGLEPWLARILQTGELNAQDSVVCDNAMLVATPQGRLLWSSPQADRLMALAFGLRWYRRSELPPALQEVLLRLQSVQQPALRSSKNLSSALPQLELYNASGSFTLRTTQMADAKGEGRAVGIHITQRVPRVAHLLSALRALKLPQRQYELAYWLVRGLSEEQIATRMGISANTATYHRRQIYTRLGVKSRKELQGLLLAP